MIEEREGERICSNKVGRAKALVVVLCVYIYIEQMYFLLFYEYIYLSLHPPHSQINASGIVPGQRHAFKGVNHRCHLVVSTRAAVFPVLLLLLPPPPGVLRGEMPCFCETSFEDGGVFFTGVVTIIVNVRACTPDSSSTSVLF